MWLLFAFASVLLMVPGQRVPPTPCPGVFEYRPLGPARWTGHITAPAPTPGVPLIVTVQFYIAAILPSQQVGRLSLWLDKDVIARKINAETIKTVDYEVTFPIQSPLPQVDKISVNNIVVCQGPSVTARALTKVTLEHTLYPLVQPLNNNRPSPTAALHFQPDYDRDYETAGHLLNPSLDPESAPEQRWAPDRPPLPYLPTPTTRRQRPTTRRTTTTTEAPAEVGGGGEEQEDECGYPIIPPQPLILRGTPTERGQWPWLTALYLEENMTFICGATLINARYVVTAGHCLKDRFGVSKKKEDLVVVSGKFDLTRWAEPKNQAREISEIHLHPDFDYLTMSNDIAVLELDFPVTYTMFVRPICLWDSNPDLNLVVGRVGTVVGWGRDENEDKIVSKPQLARIPIVSQEDCLRSSTEFRSYTSERTLCAGFKNGTGPCSGDSGGGFVLPVTQENGSSRWYLRGIVSLALNDRLNMICDLREYVIYTDVAKYLDWLKQFRRS